MSIEIFIIACLALALAVFGAIAVGSWALTRHAQDAMRRSAYLTGVLEGKLRDREQRVKEQREEIEHLKVERSALEGERASANLRMGSGGNARADAIFAVLIGSLGVWAILWIVLVALGAVTP